MWNWDYQLPNNWKPKTDEEWEWYLIRKLNYNDLTGLTREILVKHFPRLNKELDPGKRTIVEYYLSHSPA